ncbi:MAG: hypothetical protein Q8P67_06555 [archaeon]|nr:hypothetical protein [archaeon]
MESCHLWNCSLMLRTSSSVSLFSCSHSSAILPVLQKMRWR